MAEYTSTVIVDRIAQLTLNRPESFLCLVSGGSHLLVRNELIARAFEVQET